jgi:aryl-alcohol dehydrogenase-like predicted oxidoreductase
MQKRLLGNSGLEIAPLALGGVVFGRNVDEKDSFRILDAFTDAGFNLIDTANVYSIWVPGHQGGESETVIGKWMKGSGKRDSVLIATKVGFPMAADRKGLSGMQILREVDDSLKRLQTDRIDLYQAHIDDPDTPIEETLNAFAQIIQAGKVRAIGASNFSAERLAESLRISEKEGFPSYASLQPRYNLYDRAKYEKDLEPLCLEKGLGVIPYFSLASGFLTGKYRSEQDLGKSIRGPHVRDYLNDRGYRILNALDEVAVRYHTSSASVSLAWLMARPGITAPIASATSLHQLDALTEASRVGLDQESLAFLNRASHEEINCIAA